MVEGSARSDGVGPAAHVLVAVGGHPGQPRGRFRAAVPRVLPHRRARSHAVVRRAGARHLRPRQHGRRARRWCPGRPAGAPPGPAGQPARHRGGARGAGPDDRAVRRARARRPARAHEQHLATGVLGDDHRHRPARGPGAGLLAELLGHQPGLRDRRCAGGLGLPHPVPRRRRDDAGLRPAGVPPGARVTARPRAGHAGPARLDGRRAPGPGLPDVRAPARSASPWSSCSTSRRCPCRWAPTA